MAISEESFFLDSRFEGTLQAQIQQMVASGILSGRFRAGEKLPSSRRLARHLGVSRITVTLAFNELIADDYLRSAGRSGYFVSDNAPPPPPKPMSTQKTDQVKWDRLIGQRYSGGPVVDKPADWQSYRYPFVYGQADPILFDQQNWRLCALQALGRRDFTSLTTDYAERDDELLIDFIVRHTLPRRGIIANPDEVLITAGAQNALWLTAQVLLTSRSRAAYEDPGYPDLRNILRQSHCTPEPVAVDKNGIPPHLIPTDTDIVFTTPSHQCPTTSTLPLDRRRALLARARKHDFLIVEDDYEFEMSFLGAPSPALKSLDEDGRVIYVGSFSKSLFPGLRLGFLVGAAEFIREARALRTTVLRHIPGHIQRTAAYYLSRGHYDAQMRRTKEAFRTRRSLMDAEIKRRDLEIAGSPAFGGSSFWMKAPRGVDMSRASALLKAEGVLVEAGAPFFDRVDGSGFYRLAYSSIPKARIPAGLEKLAMVLGRIAAESGHKRFG